MDIDHCSVRVVRISERPYARHLELPDVGARGHVVAHRIGDAGYAVLLVRIGRKFHVLFHHEVEVDDDV